jgi:hypothetical protein
LYGDAIHLQRAIAHLNDYIKSQFIRDEVWNMRNKG